MEAKIKVRYGDQKVVLSKEYIDSVKAVLTAEIKLMRTVHKDMPECWYCGVAFIEDFSESKNLQMIFGGKEDVRWLKGQGQIMVKVPF